MSKTKFLKGECQHCAGHVEYPAEMVGTSAECPHCGQQTELLLAAPPEVSTVPRVPIVWAVIGVVILGLGLAGALAALKRAERWAARQKHQSQVVSSADTNTDAVVNDGMPKETTQNDFAVSPIALEKGTGTSLAYAVGTLRNASNRKRFGVKVEIDLFDAAQQKIGTATDYQQVIEPQSEWRFKALVVDSKAASAKLSTIREEK